MSKSNNKRTKKSKNCNTWAQYEPPTATSPSSRLCHGGIFEGEHFLPCAVREMCRADTEPDAAALIQNRLVVPGHVRRSAAETTITIRGPVKIIIEPD